VPQLDEVTLVDVNALRSVIKAAISMPRIGMVRIQERRRAPVLLLRINREMRIAASIRTSPKARGLFPRQAIRALGQVNQNRLASC
jgi:hypothetical protein